MRTTAQLLLCLAAMPFLGIVLALVLTGEWLTRGD